MSGHAKTASQRLQQQLAGIQAWHETRAMLAPNEKAAASREARMDANRRLKALARAQQSLLARTETAIDASLSLPDEQRRRALLVHRNAWMRQKVGAALSAKGVVLLDQVEDAADGLGVALAEQPDLVLLESHLPSFPGLELVGHLHTLCPSTVVAAQVESDAEIGPLLDAGARAVFSRRIPPDVVAEQLHRALLQDPGEPLLVV